MMCRTQTHTVSGVIVLSTYFVCVHICLDSSTDLVKATQDELPISKGAKYMHSIIWPVGTARNGCKKDKKWLTVSLERRTKFWSWVRKFEQNGSNFLKPFEMMQISQIFTAHIQMWNLPRFPNERKTHDSADHETSHGFARRLMGDITTSIFVFRQLFSEQSWRSLSVSRIGSLLLLMSAPVSRLKVWLTPVILKRAPCARKSLTCIPARAGGSFTPSGFRSSCRLNSTPAATVSVGLNTILGATRHDYPPVQRLLWFPCHYSV